MVVAVIVGFKDGKISHEHIYWDQAGVLVQVGLLDSKGLPVTGAESARKVSAARTAKGQVTQAGEVSEGLFGPGQNESDSNSRNTAPKPQLWTLCFTTSDICADVLTVGANPHIDNLAPHDITGAILNL